MSGGYAADLARVHADGFTALARAAAREALDRLEPDSLVVELGCGDGTTAELLVAGGHEVVGIDLSPAMIDLARARVPVADFRVGSFADADLPRCHAVLAIGEVLGYLLDPRADLDPVLARIRRALAPGGFLLFDLAGPGRAGEAGTAGFTEGDGWAVGYRATEAGDELVREIRTFTHAGGGTWRRHDETHRLRLHDPAGVVERLRGHGLAAHTLPGYADFRFPPGWTGFVAD